MTFTKERYPQIKKVIGETEVTTTAATVAIKGESIIVICMEGNLFVNPNATAVANATALKLTAGMTWAITVPGNLSLISDSSAKYQIVFESAE